MTVTGRFRRLRFAAYLVAVAAGVAVLALSSGRLVLAQGANSMYLAPAGGGVETGATLTVDIRVSTSDQVNAVQADMTYPQNLQFLSIDGAGSAFGIDASSTGGNGQVSIARGTTSPVRGDQRIARVNFKVISAGTLALNLQNSSVALSSTTNNDVITTRTGANYTAAGPAAPAAAPPANTGTTSTDAPSRAPSAAMPITKVTPRGSTQPTPVPGNSQVELSTPVELTTAPDAARQVSKVEYLLDDKLIATVSSVPYKHEVNTEQYRNDTYTLTTKTYYADGAVDMSSASLVVRNPWNLMQIGLQLRHYAWLVIILLVVIAELIYLFVAGRRRRRARLGQVAGTSSVSAGTVAAEDRDTTLPGGPVIRPQA